MPWSTPSWGSARREECVLPDTARDVRHANGVQVDVDPFDFSVTVGRHRDTIVLAPAGELDLATAPLLADHLDVIDPGVEPVEVVLDLSAITFLDSSGVALLVGISRRAARDGWGLTITGARPDALRVLALCGLLDVLPLRVE
jgi:anti-sigma B factor antagonist